MGARTDRTWETSPTGAIRPPRIPVLWGYCQPPIHHGHLRPAPDGSDWVIDTEVSDVGSGRIFVAAEITDGGDTVDARGVAIVLQQARLGQRRISLRIEFEFFSPHESLLREATGLQPIPPASPPAPPTGVWGSLDPDGARRSDDGESGRASWATVAEAAVDKITEDEERRSSMDSESMRAYSTVRWRPTLYAAAVAGFTVLLVTTVALLVAWPFSS